MERVSLGLSVASCGALRGAPRQQVAALVQLVPGVPGHLDPLDVMNSVQPDELLPQVAIADWASWPG